MQSENTQTTDAPGGDVDAQAGVSDLGALRDLLAADNDESTTTEVPGGDTDGEASGDAPKNAKPVFFNDLAGVNDLKIDDLYALKIKFGSDQDSKELTIEELKDLGKQQDEIVMRELKWEEDKSKQEADLRRAQNELTEIVQGLPQGSLNEKVLSQVRERQAQREQRERALTLQAIPSWQDENVRTAELAGMAAYMEGFGFPKNYLAAVVDHRQMAFIRQSFLREQRIKAALEKVTPASPGKAATPAGANTPPGTTTPKPTGHARNGLEAFFNTVE